MANLEMKLTNVYLGRLKALQLVANNKVITLDHQ